MNISHLEEMANVFMASSSISTFVFKIYIDLTLHCITVSKPSTNYKLQHNASFSDGH